MNQCGDQRGKVSVDGVSFTELPPLEGASSAPQRLRGESSSVIGLSEPKQGVEIRCPQPPNRERAIERTAPAGAWFAMLQAARVADIIVHEIRPPDAGTPVARTPNMLQRLVPKPM